MTLRRRPLALAAFTLALALPALAQELARINE